jgi:hypothetical protein
MRGWIQSREELARQEEGICHLRLHATDGSLAGSIGGAGGSVDWQPTDTTPCRRARHGCSFGDGMSPLSLCPPALLRSRPDPGWVHVHPFPPHAPIRITLFTCVSMCSWWRRGKALPGVTAGAGRYAGHE